MQKIFTKIKNQKGYAILFTVIIIGAISALTAGLTNTVYKQLILSSLVKNSQSAFYQADTAGGCALYADLMISPEMFQNEGKWSCGGYTLMIHPKEEGELGIGSYDLVPENEDSIDPCFRISVTKTLIGSTEDSETKIIAQGYNICNKSNPRVVEREIEINY